ncbi:MAG: MaoC family dehydratase [Pseudomonadota bacterium]|nr:MaoC family dehydratase [Pseudomonadota bacterium]
MVDTITPLSLQTDARTTAAYATLSRDHNPLHLDAAFAAKTPFGQPIIHGAMALDLLMNAVEATLGQPGGENLSVRFSAPVKVGERITAGGEWNSDGYDIWVRKDDGTDVITGRLTLGADANA